MSDDAKSLYERIGGEEAISGMVDSFYEKVIADPILAPYFKDVPMDRLRTMQRELFGAATGGPVVYSGRPLREVHQHMGISRGDLQRFTDILISTLESHGIANDDVRDIMSRINIYADEITDDMPEYG